MGLMTTQEAAVWLGVSVSLLQHDVSYSHLGVPYLKVGNRVRYRQEDLESWAADQVRAPESPKALAARMSGMRLRRGAKAGN